MDTSLLPILLGIAVLLPLVSFFVILALGRWWTPATGGYIATAAIVSAGVLSAWSLAIWLTHHPIRATEHHATNHAAADQPQVIVVAQTAPGTMAAHDAVAQDAVTHPEPDAGRASAPPYVGDYYMLGQFGRLRMTIGYYIDSLTIVMCCMVSLIASCIHFYALGYMHEELHTVTDHEVTLQDGSPLQRPGRFSNFFQYMSLFCFSMLGLVLAGNVAMVFVFWELVGICSYFLIGFYIERKSASNAANKAFLVNRIGDFGMIIGLMALWAGLGTFAFGDADQNKNGTIEPSERGIFSLVRPVSRDHALTTPDGMVLADAQDEIRRWAQSHPAATKTDVEAHALQQMDDLRTGGPDGSGRHYGYWLLVVAGVGIFCGCVGKSAQFPLHVWLPDAMEGPTPVSALVHSATMVAAGVYLVGRFYPVFTPEVLLVIAVTGVITLFMAATIAITATDIKRVLAYSTVSQLGYMMMALGVGGWLAGMMHLVTHAFFKSLLFLCSGSVIHAVHSNDMMVMGGLRKKMPVTATTMLIGCLAIAGMGIPFVIGLSGYYSKDMILEQAFSFARENSTAWGRMFFVAAAGGAAITAFYMFRLWFLTFTGQPRDAHRYEQAHESPRVMYIPLIILAVFAISVAWQMPFGSLSLQGLLEQSRPAGTAVTVASAWVPLLWPSEHIAHQAANYRSIVVPVTWLAFTAAVGGMLLALAMYVLGRLNPSDVSGQFAPIYGFLKNKWWFDELYDFLFVRPVHAVSRWCAAVDRRWIDWLIDSIARWTAHFAVFCARLTDHTLIDGLLDRLASWTYRVGISLRGLQTGSLRQYVLFLVLGVIAVFLISSFF
jgi:NADH:ubiquinone oxidoreductase subunit 5 (subunit L)/multisubunit Na+/H+ antiporter MnhA subunit